MKICALFLLAAILALGSGSALASGAGAPSSPSVNVADDQGSEFHWMLCGDDLAGIESKMSFTDADKDSRKLVYLDSADQVLYSQGAVLRVRASDKKTELTAKLVFDDPSQFKKSWLKDSHTSCEWDVNPKGKSFACSVDYEISGMSLDRKNPAQLLNLFDDHQQKFLADHNVAWPAGKNVRIAGPVDFESSKYKVKHGDLSGKWSVEDLLLSGTHLFDGVELSVRLDDAMPFAEVSKQLLQRGLRPCADQGSKTKAVLDRFLIR